ncbi:MAG TPA: membrane dipeptidase [Humisphaera sp.]|nr:membrane dipeptidase [Humisphaera sp.]
MFIVDAHLDIAYNALRGREVHLHAADQKPDEEGIPSVGLPDLRAGDVGLICATIFCQPALPNHDGYRSSAEAAGMAQRQLQWYQKQEQEGRIQIIRGAADLPSGMNGDTAYRPTSAILLMEGADAIQSPADVRRWHEAGLRAIGLAWKRTRYAGGTGAPGPLTSEGVALVAALDEAGIVHDVSHLAEESFWQLLEISSGPVMASHSNCRAFVPTDRQLSDEMIRALAARGAVIGINFFDKFLIPPDDYGKRRATLVDVMRHLRHMCDVIGDARHVGIGTDMDGGLGREQIPVEIRSSADLPRVADALTAFGFGDEDVRNILGQNWLRFFRRALDPAARLEFRVAARQTRAKEALDTRPVA